MPRQDDSPEEAALRSEARRFLGGRLRPRTPGSPLRALGAGSDDLAEGRELLALLDEQRWAAPTWPVELGGRGISWALAAVFQSELARFETPDLYPYMVGIALVGPTLMAHGTPAQQRRWLPDIRTGSAIWCQLFSEPGAGSDLAGLSCRATRRDGSWLLTGQKVWSSRAHYADLGLLLARTDTSVPKHAGITCFALDMQAPGVDVRPMRQMNGDSHFNEVFLDEVEVADDDRIGDPGRGWQVAVTTLAFERGAVGSGASLIGREQLLALLAGGSRSDPLIRQRAATAAAAMEAARLTALRARARARTGREPGPEGSGAKLRSSAVFKAVTDLAMDVLGPRAVAEEGEWQTLFLTAPSLSIRGGTDEIQRNILGERVLGLPREPRPDRDH